MERSSSGTLAVVCNSIARFFEHTGRIFCWRMGLGFTGVLHNPFFCETVLRIYSTYYQIMAQ